MELILLGGNSLRNKEWIESVRDYLKGDFTSTHVHSYLHWQTKEEMIDIDHEVDSLVSYVGDRKDYMVFAKSAGSLVVVKGIYEGKLHPQRCVFAGFPVRWAEGNKLDIHLWLEHYSVPTIFVQNSHDEAIYAEDLRTYLKELHVDRYEVVALPGNTHSYNDFEKLKEVVRS